MQFKNKTFLIAGLKSSGISAANLLLSLGANVLLYDDDATAYGSDDCCSLIKKTAKIAHIKRENENFYEECKNLSSCLYAVIISPGVPIDNPVIVALKRLGVTIIGEAELAYYFLKSPIIAVSGTNGKTTVSNLIHSALLSAGESSYLMGNVGVPMSGYALKLTPNDIAVAEISSFQLESIRDFKPHIGVMLNITPDHLNRHYSMENYIYLKKRLFSNMGATEYAVLSYDDPVVRDFSRSIKSAVTYFSTKSRVDGAYLDGNMLTYFGTPICSADDLKIRGAHNIANALAAIAALKLYGISDAAISSALKNFQGVPHRIEAVGEYDSVIYYNDSKSTNVDSAVKAIAAMDRETVLILGGSDKNQDYKPLFEVIKNSKVIHTVILGEVKEKLFAASCCMGFSAVTLTDTLKSAVLLARALAPSGGAVLFSPASASFDMFSSFKERGDAFRTLVKSIADGANPEKSIVSGADREKSMANSADREKSIADGAELEKSIADGANPEKSVANGDEN